MPSAESASDLLACDARHPPLPPPLPAASKRRQTMTGYEPRLDTGRKGTPLSRFMSAGHEAPSAASPTTPRSTWSIKAAAAAAAAALAPTPAAEPEPALSSPAASSPLVAASPTESPTVSTPPQTPQCMDVILYAPPYAVAPYPLPGAMQLPGAAQVPDMPTGSSAEQAGGPTPFITLDMEVSADKVGAAQGCCACRAMLTLQYCCGVVAMFTAAAS